MKNLLTFITVISLFAVINCAVDPPVWAKVFKTVFVQNYGEDTHFRTVGTLWYDYNRQASRVDRNDGKHQPICGSVLPNVTTACSQLVKNGKRYMIFRQQRKCCLCCDAAHGCGILKPDWLKTSKYQGRQQLSGGSFDKWSIPDGDDTDLYWATTDAKQIPRKINEGGQVIKDFIMQTYTEQTIPETVFELPTYCDNTPCPKTSKCGSFQGNKVYEQE